MKNVKKLLCSVTAIIGIVIGGSVPDSESGYPGAVGPVHIQGEYIGDLIVSHNALDVIGNSEGCRQAPYRCPAGLNTDGIGNTHNVTGAIKTNNQIAVDWVKNIISAQNCLTASADVTSMSQGQIDAFTSFIFNTGCTRFKYNRNGSKTRIFKKISADNFMGACQELGFWVYGGGKKLLGLVERRRKETMLCTFSPA